MVRSVKDIYIDIPYKGLALEVDIFFSLDSGLNLNQYMKIVIFQQYSN